MVDVTTGAIKLLVLPNMGFKGGDIVFVDPAGTYALVTMRGSRYDYPGVYRFDLATGKAKPVRQLGL